MFEKKKKVKWLVMFSAVWPQIMISWMIWWVVDCIGYGRTGQNTLRMHFLMIIYFWVHVDISYLSVMLSRLVSMLNPFPGMKHLDVAGGTGKLWYKTITCYKKKEEHFIWLEKLEWIATGSWSHAIWPRVKTTIWFTRIMSPLVSVC